MEINWNVVLPFLTAFIGFLASPIWNKVAKYFDNKNAAKSKLELKKLEVESAEHTNLSEKYEKLLVELKETKEELQKIQLHLDKAIVAFEMLMPLLEENFKDNDAYLEIIRQAEIHIKHLDE